MKTSLQYVHSTMLIAVLLTCLPPAAKTAAADDWPRWNGPTRDGVIHEEGILTEIPAEGLRKLWEHPVKLGYAGPAVVGGRVYVPDYQKSSGKIVNNPGTRDELTGRERLLCLDAATGKELWKHEYEQAYAVSYGGGPRATPTVHDGRVYMLGAEGALTCLQADSGKVLWSHDLKREYQSKTPQWGHAAAPLVYHNSLICLVGGPDSLVVSFDRVSGREQWRALAGENHGYCPPTVITAGGVDQLLIWDPETLHSLNPDNGREYWQFALKPGYGMSILPPVLENNLLFTSGEGDASLMLKLADDSPTAEELWRGNARTSMYLATGAAIFDNGHLYGSDIRSGALVCARASDGKRLWQTAVPTSGSKRGRGGNYASAFLMKIDSRYLIFSETGDMISATLTPEAYHETGRFHAIDPTGNAMGRTLAWTYPAVSDGRLFLRNDQQVVCYDLSADGQP
ncbi:MAG: PQQ-like beta-propeller repeat protein [Fuerstiella sp.]